MLLRFGAEDGCCEKSGDSREDNDLAMKELETLQEWPIEEMGVRVSVVEDISDLCLRVDEKTEFVSGPDKFRRWLAELRCSSRVAALGDGPGVSSSVDDDEELVSEPSSVWVISTRFFFNLIEDLVSMSGSQSISLGLKLALLQQSSSRFMVEE
jgi:hypothetical protein